MADSDMADNDEAHLRLGTGIERIYQGIISGENQQSSPLLRLLAELRLKIYEYALSDWEVSMTHEPYPPWPFGLRKLRCRRIDTSKGDWIAPANAILGLSLVCRQIRIETLPFGFTLDNKYHWLTTRSKKGMFDRLGEERCKLLQKSKNKTIAKNFSDEAIADMKRWWIFF